MDLEEKVGQLFFVGFEGTEESAELRAFLADVRPGGVVHFARNIQEVRQVQDLNRFLSASLTPAPLIAVDEEGGRVSRLKPVLPALPSPASIARKEEGFIRSFASALGEALAALGFNTDFAPVVDLSTPGASNQIGDRSFGEDERRVTRCAREFLAGLAESNVASFLKHFPGLGATEVDSHVELPTCRRDEKQLWERDLLPFRECAEAAAGVMVAHVHCPMFDPGIAVAASLSTAVVTGLLRERMGYQGVALTDDLEMGALAGPSPSELASQALRAGNDMVMFCNNPDWARHAYRGVLAAARAGELSLDRIDRSIRRITAVKERLGVAGAASQPPAPTWDSARARLSAYAVA